LTTSEILILGAGVIGLSIAREAHRRGFRNIRILEKGRVGREASWAAAGILAPQVEANSADDFFDLCFESNRMYDGFAAALFEETGVDIELDSCGTLYAGFNELDSHEFDTRFAWQKAAGLNVERLTKAETLKIEPALSPKIRESLRFPHDRQVENRKLVEALSAYARSNEIEVIENQPVRQILVESDRVTGVRSSERSYLADQVVIATGAWTSFIELGEDTLPLEVRPIRGQMISFRLGETRLKHVIYSHRGYVVPRADGRLLAGATVEDVGFDKSTTEMGVSKLREMAAEIAPSIRDLTIQDTWAGLRPMSADGRPVIGAIPGVEGLSIAAGHYRNGILLSPMTAKLIVDLITGDKSNKFLNRFGLGFDRERIAGR